MAQKEGAGFGAIDPFGQFLMAAYLQGMVPGSQTSAYNTVLDLLSPGAVAGRMEAGTPNVAEQFENMFGGTQLTPDQISQMQSQAAGLTPTPGQALEARTAMNKALQEYLAASEATKASERVGMAGVDVQREDLALKREMLPIQLGEIQARTGMYERQGKEDPQDPRAQAAKMNLDIQSIVMYGSPWDAATGKPSEVKATLQQVQAARALTGLQQQGPAGQFAASTMNTLLNSDDEALKAYGRTMFEQISGFSYDEAGIWNFGKVVTPTGANDQAIRDRIAYLETMMPQAMNPESIQAEIERLKGQLGVQ
jgi:hypothetical protein